MAIFESIAQLRAELGVDLDYIRLNAEKNRLMASRMQLGLNQDEFAYAALGYTLHNLYNAFESYFLRVAKFFENNIAELGWHKSLVDRMTLTIEGVRPALFDLAFAERMVELLRFRHVFRNLYKAGIVPEKLAFAARAAENIDVDFLPFHRRFDEFLLQVQGT